MKLYQLVTFKIMGVAFGVRTNQIFKIFNPEKLADQDVDVYSFDQIIPFKNKGVVQYKTPRIIIPVDNRETYGIKVESPDDIISAREEDIRPIPYLIAKGNISNAFYGVITHNDRIIFLIDFLNLLDEAKQRCK